MNAEIFTALCNRLENEVPEIRWIDEDEGQLNTSVDARPAVDFPCCLIDIQYPDCKDTSESEQLVSTAITLKLAFLSSGETYNKAPERIRDKALNRLFVVQKVHECLQGWTAGEIISPVSRKSARPSVLPNKIKIYTVVYNTTFTEV